jgi:hypothetical protein
MLMRVLLILLLLINTLFAAPVKTIINGEIKNGGGKWVRLYEYTNQISYNTKKISADSIAKQGSFRIELLVEKGETKTVFFTVERFRSVDFYLEAGQTYNLVFDTLDFSIQDEMYSPLTSNFPKLTFHQLNNPDDLNNQISRFLNELVSFSDTEFLDVIRNRRSDGLDAFRNKIDSLFAGVKNPFFKIIVDYSFAELQFTARLRNNAYFVGTYFNDTPFQYDNPAFMNFFNVFFDKFIYTTSRKILPSDLELHIVREKNYRALLDSLGKDTLLKNEVVRDMVLIKNLHQMYFANYLHRDKIFDLMSDISQMSKFPKHRQIASALLSEMNLHGLKRKAPPLIARESDGQYFYLDSMKGTYTYLLFFTTYCRICYPELNVLNSIYPKFSNQVYFVTVSMDVNFLKFYYFMNDYKYPWEFVNFFRNFDIEDDWGVKVYPHAFMIDPDGYIINDNAPMPSEYLENYLREVLKADLKQ